MGWVDLVRPDATERLGWLTSQPEVVGMRNWAMTRSDPLWLASADLDDGFAALAASRLTYDALVNSSNLRALRDRLARTPGLRVCIDHFAYPRPDWPHGGREEQDWIGHLSALAAEGCTIKLSGFGHKVDGRWQPHLFSRYVDIVLDVFGPEQTMWASNWPTVLTECSFRDWYDASRDWTAGLSVDEHGQLFGGTARSFYGV
ncbi:amidohydrolase family protein [Mesorhizobium sp. M0166]|uniref:amidohydrolase family protein n=1 Tax=unclassified Mesorhizobium TaxID=325217 RepID=UPI003334C826